MKTGHLGERITMASTLATGFGLVWALVANWTWYGIRDRFEPDDAEYLSVSWDGELFATSYIDWGTTATTYRALGGGSAEGPVSELWGAYLYDGRNTDSRDELSVTDRVWGYQDGRTSAGYWFFVHDGKPDGSGYFVGFDRDTAGCLGYIGMAGFRTEPIPHEERFAVAGLLLDNRAALGAAQGTNPGWYPGLYFGVQDDDFFPWLVYIVSAGNVYEVDLNTRQCRPIQTMGFGPAVSLAMSLAYSDPWTDTRRLVIRTEKGIVVRNARDETIRRVVLPAHLTGSRIEWYELGDGRAIASVERRDPESNFETTRCYHFLPDGTLRDDSSFQLRSRRAFWGESIFAPVRYPGVLPMTWYIVFVRAPRLGAWSDGSATRAVVGRYCRKRWLSVLAALFTSVLAASVCYAHQRRYKTRRPERLIWPVLVLLIGLPGLAGYWWHRRWPVLVQCEGCHRRVPRDRSACPCCGSEFRVPAPTGVETFA